MGPVALDPRRYPEFADQSYVVAKALEIYQNEYAIGFPVEERPAGRPAKTSPLYHRAEGARARCSARAAAGSGRCVSAEPRIAEQTAHASGGRTGIAGVGEECEAVAERVGMLDLAGFTSFELSGPGAAAWLDSLVAGALPKAGRSRRSPMS